MSLPSPDVRGTVLEDPVPELSRVYAEAILNAAQEAGQAEEVLGELEELLGDLWNPRPDFVAMITSPSIPTVEKDRVLTQAFEGRALPIVLNFLRVLNRHGRLGYLKPIVGRARALWDQRQNRKPVVVRSARPLDADQRARLSARLERLIGATPNLQVEIDPGLIGGLVIQVGDTVLDASVRTVYLRDMRRRLVEQTSHSILSRPGDS